MIRDYHVRGTGPSSLRKNARLLADVVPGLGEPSKVVAYDDFLGDTLDATWSGGSGADGSSPALNAQSGGVVRLATGGGTSGFGGNISSLTLGLNFQADKGEMLARARVQIDNKANSWIFVGFTDTLASSSAEQPFSLDGSNALTSTATDAAGFLYDSTGSDYWFVAGVAGDTDAGPTQLDQTPANGTWVELEVRVRSSGLAEFILDGSQVAQLASAVTPGTALTPIVAASDDNTGSRILDVDWVLTVAER